MARFMVQVFEAEPGTNTRWKPLLKEQFDDEHEPEHGGYTPLEWALLEAVSKAQLPSVTDYGDPVKPVRYIDELPG